MQIDLILKSEAIRVVAQMSSKKRLFNELAEIAASVYGVDSAAVVDGLQERESLGPTGVGHGIALPHARLETLDRIAGVFVRLERPLDFEAVDRQPVDLIFALLAPKDSGVDHLKALASISRTMRDPTVCAKLRANAAPETLFTVLTSPRASAAA